MDVRGWVIVAAVLAVGFSGCSGKSGSADNAAQSSEEDAATKGTVVGLVTDDESQPLEGVSIALKTVKVSPIAIKILTNSGGRFQLDKVPAGKQTVEAVREGFLDSTTTITVIPGTETTVRLVMQPRPITTYKIQPMAPINGFYTCAVEYIQASGACDYEAYNHTGTYPLGAPKNNNTFNVTAGWGGIYFQITWEIGGGHVAGIRFQMESQEDLGGMFIKASGTVSPLIVKINAGEVAGDATLGYPIPQRGVSTWLHVLPLGEAEGATCATGTCGYGVGAAVNIKYTITPTLFFGGPVDPNYSPSGG